MYAEIYSLYELHQRLCNTGCAHYAD